MKDPDAIRFVMGCKKKCHYFCLFQFILVFILFYFMFANSIIFFLPCFFTKSYNNVGVFSLTLTVGRHAFLFSFLPHTTFFYYVTYGLTYTHFSFYQLLKLDVFGPYNLPPNSLYFLTNAIDL